jgi:mannitol 2-dehydrogenase
VIVVQRPPDVRPLQRAALRSMPSVISAPSYDARALRAAVVHLGLGSFARAHVAVYLDRLAESGASRDWGLVGGGLRSASVRSALRRQDNLWTVVDPRTDRVRVVGVLQDYVDATRTRRPLLHRLTDPRTELVTLTITAPAYHPADGAVASVGPGWHTFGLIAEALRQRRVSGLGPFTVLSCDNLPDNGAATRRGVVTAAEAVDPASARWIERSVAFPSSMVDRITPAATEVQRRMLRHTHGIVDELALFPESFSQWVVADEFIADRPPWHEVGVQMVSDVRPFVDAKTRLLNGSHVALGFLGPRLGHHTVAEAMADPRVAVLVDRLMRDEVQPTLSSVPTDVSDYRRAVRARLTDGAVPDSLDRLRRRGSARVANYVVPTLRDALAGGTPSTVLTRTVAAWVDHLCAVGAEPAARAALEDPLAEELLPLARLAAVDPRPLLSRTDVFADLGCDTRFVSALRGALADLQEGDRTVAS